MKVVGEIELSGIKRIVINRTSVWEVVPVWGPSSIPGKERTDVEIKYVYWKKTSGGPGFFDSQANSKRKTPAQMMAHINNLLTMGTIAETSQATHKGDLVSTVNQKLAYRCWPSGDTLNIVRKEREH